ncbi:MAG TPA: zinc ribbon domain-containing protein [Candidatus Bariatricus faecipullorum]|nr:zinc ribbon domain-containing protein [Candidatus Bariatricus faecipullorum]
MERLTHYRMNGIKEGYWSPNKKQELVDRLAQYEDAGLNPEEIQELKQRDKAKVPDYEGDGYDDDGNIIYDIWICPNCGEKYEVDYDDYKFCPKCGQRIKWED